MDVSCIMGDVAQCMASMPGQQVMCCVCGCVGTSTYFHGLLSDKLSCSYWQVPHASDEWHVQHQLHIDLVSSWIA